MKAHAIEQICRKSREVYVYRRGDADFVGDGNACYVATWARGLRPNDLLGLFGVCLLYTSRYKLPLGSLLKQ